MKFLECDLEEIIYNSDRDLLLERGLSITGKTFRQLKVGRYGVADLIELKRPYYHSHFKTMMKGTITVYELKKDNISISAFLQALRYLKGIKRFLESNKKSISNCFNYEIVLIGRSIDINSSIIYLTDFFTDELGEYDIDDTSKTFISFYKYDFDIEGLKFEPVFDYRLTNEGF